MNANGSEEGVPAALLARFIKYCLIKRKKADLSTEALKKVYCTIKKLSFDLLGQSAQSINVSFGYTAMSNHFITF